MDAGDGDTLARSQLALLYRLGLLHQDAGEVENDPHAFLNRLPPPESAAGADDATERRLQTSGEDWKHGTATARSPYAPVAPYDYEPVLRIKTRRVASASGSATARVPLSPLSTASSVPRRSRFSLAAAVDDAITPQQRKQRWFHVWKMRVERKWVLDRAHAMARRCTQRHVLSKWQAAVYRAQVSVARVRQLECWKAKRALRMWAAFATLHGRVTWFLTSQGRGSALMNRLRRQRAFVRWGRFVQWSAHQRKLIARASAFHQSHSLRQWWLQWRIYVFQVRRRLVVFHAFFHIIRSEQARRQSRWETACELYASHAGDRLTRLLRRWRLFNDARQREHVRSWQVRMVVRRGRYFSIWYAALCHKGRIEALRLRVQRRIKRDHLQAWSTAARAGALGRCSTLWHPEAIRARYLSVWKRWTRDTIRFRIATAQVHARRKRRSLRVMRAWTAVHARDSQLQRIADAVTRRRILLHVWENGWMVFHSRRQIDKAKTQQIVLMAHARVLGLWRLAWAVRHEWREKKAIARKLGLRAAIYSAWDGWRRHTVSGRLHKQQLQRACRYYRQRLVTIGLAAFSSIVDTKSTHATAARRIRVGQRTGLIRRTFCGWKGHTQRVRSLEMRLSQFLANPMRVRSLWNPLRRAWLRWILFTRIRLRLREITYDRSRRSKCSVFGVWKRRAFVCSEQRAYLWKLQDRRRKKAFTTWKLRSSEWRARSELHTRARVHYLRTSGSKALRAWNALVCGRRRHARSHYEQVKTKYQLDLARRSLSHWWAKLKQRRGIHVLEARRRYAWLDFCWNRWHRYHLRQSKFKRKREYFGLVYGMYPAVSPFRRLWDRWKSQTVLGVAASKLKRRYEIRNLGACLSAWKTFRLARLALRSWHTFSIVTSATNNDQGKRIRLFRLKRQQRLVRRVMFFWAQATHSRQVQQERLALNRQRILREIECSAANRRKRRRCLLRMWFQRWRRRQLVALHAAVNWHRKRLCFRVIRDWWRQVIHRKQERLLQDARQTVELMSAHKVSRLQPLRGVKDDQKLGSSTGRRVMKPNNVLANRSNGASSAPKRARGSAKRMFDPEMYAATYQDLNVRASSQPTRSEQHFQRRITPPPRVERDQVRTESVRDRHDSREPALLTTERRVRRTAPSELHELPLFDDDQVTGSSRTVAQDCKDTPRPPARTEVNQTLAESAEEPVVSLESLASMDPYSPVRQPSHAPQHPLLHPSSRAPPQNAQLHSADQVHRVPGPEEPSGSVPTLYTPRQSLRQQDARNSFIRRQPRPNTPAKRTSVQRGLAEILEIPQQTRTQNESAFRSVLQDMKAQGNDDLSDLDVDGVVKIIIDHYILITRSCGMTPDHNTKLGLETSGYCMLRDLGLFTNEYYVAAMEQAIRRIQSDQHDVRQLMRGLLCEFIDRHPHFLSTTASNTGAHANRLDPLGWLVTCYLTKRLGRATLSRFKESPGRPFWVRHELPHDVVSSLAKLTKCINKYQKPLEQFFAWRPEKASGTPTRRLMDHATFVLLMKHSNVYPQLFDRREIEYAMECAGSRHHHSAGTTSFDTQLDFPQFVEALLRCALRLKWIDEPGERAEEPSSSSDVVVVVKFLMLIFAMEGRGSMLTKRSQDLEVVMQFLKRQQESGTKSAKLRRFQGLLRAETQSTKTRRPKHSSAFRVAMADRADEPGIHTDMSRGAEGRRYDSLTSVYPIILYNADTEVDDSKSRPQLGSRELSRELRTRIEAKFEMEEGHDEMAAAGDSSVQRTDHEHARDQATVTNKHESGVDKRRLDSDQPFAGSGGIDGKPETRQQHSVGIDSIQTHSDPRIKADGGSASHEISELAVTQSGVGIGTDHGLHAPMDRDAFLKEILSSIQDVELLLQQSDVRRPTVYQAEQGAAERDVELTSEPFSAAYPERYSVLMNGRLPSGMDLGEDNEASMLTDDVRVSDPLLDSLTFTDRFSESRDWQSHLSIADLAAHGIHAAFPSAMHVRAPLDTGELDDLTDPQRTTAYLRTESEDEEITFDELIRLT